MSDQDVQGWLFLLLTLHHLPPDAAPFPSSMSPDATTWWHRSRPPGRPAKPLYTRVATSPLMDVADQTACHRRRPNRGSTGPLDLRDSPSLPRQSGARLSFHIGNAPHAHRVGGIRPGDPAMEFARAAGLAALSGDLDSTVCPLCLRLPFRNARPRDATMEERIQVFASVLPLGFCFVMMSVLAEDKQATAEERDARIAQVERALTWIHDTLGVELGDTEMLLAPLA